MGHILRYVTLITVLFLGWTTVYGIKPSRSIDIQSIEKKYPNVSFERVVTPDRCHLLVADIAPIKKDKHTAILICYPDSGNIQQWLGYGLVLAEMGYHTMMFDYRGFGGSDRFTIEKDTLYYDEFSTDANTVYNHLARKHPDCRIGLFGMSMGSIMTTSLALKHKGDFIIGDSYVSDLDSAVSQIEKIYHRKMTLPYSAYEYNQDLRYVRQPILLLNGKYDTICPQGSSMFYNSKHAEAIVYNGGHMEGPLALKQTYFSKIDQFIGKISVPDKESGSSIPFYLIMTGIVGLFIGRSYVSYRKSKA